MELEQLIGASPEFRAALAIAEEEYPDLDVEEVLVRLDRLGARVRARAPVPERAASTLSALRHVLVEEEGLRGNERDYHDPRNSFLNEVLERKLGIPMGTVKTRLRLAFDKLRGTLAPLKGWVP